MLGGVVDKNTEELLKRLRFIKKNFVWNQMIKNSAIENLKKWTRLGDLLIDRYEILNYNDCIFIMELLQSRIDFLKLRDEYIKIKKELDI
jgi:hypothetical protein